MQTENTANKIKEIQSLLAKGKTRVEVAKAMGYSNVSCLYRYALHHKLKWNPKKKNYDAIEDEENLVETEKILIDYPSGKEANIISMFKNGMDGREIAKKLRFSNYQALADFMKSKGYAWNNYKNNYVKEPREIKPKKEEKKEVEQSKSDSLDKYLEILEMIYKNQDRLGELLNATDNPETIPRYILAGITITKSINIINTLDQLVKDYSQEKNISQKQIVEVALIEFLRKYGYSDELKANLKI